MSKSMLIKILTALVLVAIVIPPFYFGGTLLHALIIVVTFLSAYEISSMYDQKPHWAMTIFISIIISVLTIIPKDLYFVVLTAYIISLFILLLINEKYHVDELAYQVLITLIISQALTSVSLIYESDMKFYGMLFVALATYMCDTGAYFFGVFFGKHKMIPRVSPHKTWEGAIGGYFTGAITSFLFAYFFAKQLSLGLIVTTSLILPAIAEIGDLAFSSIKRRFDIKDFGSFLPGHGGILDRIDSLLFCLMVFHALLLVWGY